ncbi:MAG TPA: DUF748 domain-containing protein, partial [Gammaproteobacteria bacterium]|nr:DUF748 domain-containing protein [Gammaproteobacteria bacterium]
MIRRLISLAHPLRRYRRLGVVAAALLGSYALAGFLLVPWVVQRTAVASLAESLQRPVRVDGVSFNPFALSAEIRGFVVAEVDGSRVFAFERLYANLQASSLLRWAWTFRELHLEGPALEVIRDADGALNLARLAPRAETGAAAPPAQTAPAAAPRLVVGELVIARGTVHVEDRLPATDFETVIGPVNVEMFDLSTLPDDEGQYQIAVTTELGSRLQWSGSVQISPLRSSGHVTGSGPFAALLSRFVQDTVAFTLPEGRLELAFDYTLGAAGDVGFFATVDGAELAVLDVALQHDAGAAPFLTLTEARLRGGAVRWPERSATAELVSLVGARLAATRSPSGELDLLGLAEAAPAEAPGEPDGSAGERDADPFGGWSLGVAELRVADFRASFEDRTLPTPATLELADLDLTLHDLTTAPGAQSRYELAARLGAGGELASAGTVSAWPGVSLAGSLTATQIPLGAAQPYVGELARVAIEGGTVDAELE